MTNRDIYIAAILDYLLLRETRLEQVTHLHNKCDVLDVSPRKKFYLMVKDEDIFLYVLSENKVYMIDKNIIKNAKEEDRSSVEYFLDGVFQKYDARSLINNVVWNEDERRVSFSEIYSNITAEYGQLLECDFSKEKMRIRRSRSYKRLYKPYPKDDETDEQEHLPSVWIDEDWIW